MYAEWLNLSNPAIKSVSEKSSYVVLTRSLQYDALYWDMSSIGDMLCHVSVTYVMPRVCDICYVMCLSVTSRYVMPHVCDICYVTCL